MKSRDTKNRREKRAEKSHLIGGNPFYYWAKTQQKILKTLWHNYKNRH